MIIEVVHSCQAHWSLLAFLLASIYSNLSLIYFKGALSTSKEVGKQLVPEVIKRVLISNVSRLDQGGYYTPLDIPDPELDRGYQDNCMDTCYIL